jgi:hypothetical protein
MLLITIKRAHIVDSRRMRHCSEQSSGSVRLQQTQSCITNTFGYDFRKGQDAKMIKLAEIAMLFRAAAVSPLIAEKRRTEIDAALQVIDIISNLSGLDRRLELCIKQAKSRCSSIARKRRFSPILPEIRILTLYSPI